FSGRERRVEITGEAYFEVMQNTKMPFIVENGGAEIQVLGTHFDVNAYDDEASMKVTLLEGSVRIIKGNSRQQLIPGQQAQVNADGKIALSNDVDKDEVMAWKNGEFQFDKTDIEVVMRQISRWYNVDITYQGVVTARFWGSISRNVNASEVLHMLEQTGTVRFRIEGRKVIVIPS
ncbi:MAG TPA: FecR domain-containing protein, partial [Chitinophagaceae bacterium]